MECEDVTANELINSSVKQASSYSVSFWLVNIWVMSRAVKMHLLSVAPALDVNTVIAWQLGSLHVYTRSFSFLSSFNCARQSWISEQLHRQPVLGEARL